MNRREGQEEGNSGWQEWGKKHRNDKELDVFGKIKPTWLDRRVKMCIGGGSG